MSARETAGGGAGSSASRSTWNNRQGLTGTGSIPLELGAGNGGMGPTGRPIRRLPGRKTIAPRLFPNPGSCYVHRVITVASIQIYPIKSLDGVPLQQVEVLPAGPLAGDREFALLDEAGQFVNGKRFAQLHRLRATYDLARRLVTLSDAPQLPETTLHLDRQRRELADLLGGYLGLTIHVAHDPVKGFPDDPLAPGPTVIAKESLAEAASWFPELEPRRFAARFRANVEVEGGPPFWEDCLVGSLGCPVPFEIGNVHLLGVNPCQRCAVPSRDPQTGEVSAEFQRRFSQGRRLTLSDWAPRSRFDHFYRFSVNTALAFPGEPAGVIQLGDCLDHDGFDPSF